MGLDMFVYEARRPEPGEYEFFDEFYGFHCDTDEWEHLPERDKDIEEYCIKTDLKVKKFNCDKFDCDHDLLDMEYLYEDVPEKPGDVLFVYVDKNDNKHRLEITKEEYNEYVFFKVREMYIADLKQVAYWRKYYGLQDAIHDLFENEGVCIENCGFYKLTPNMIEYLNREFDLELPESDDLIYHEWY